MNKQHLTTTAWICLAIGTFALGWMMKPVRQGDGSGVVGGSGSSTSTSPSRMSNSRRAADEAGREGRSSARPAAAAPLTAQSIASLGAAFRAATDPILKREAFAKLLAGLTPENALEIRAQIADLDSNDPAFRDFHFAWGKIAGLEAVLHGADTEKSDMAPTLAGWAAADPAAAMAWFDSLEEQGGSGMNQGQFKEAMVRGLVIADPAAAVGFVMEMGQAGDPRSKQMMGIVASMMIQSGGAAAAGEWAAALPEGDLRGHALYEVARAQVRADPEAAAAWAAPLAGDKNGGALVYGISSEWGWRNGAATVNWLDTLSGDQSAAYGPALAGWAKADPQTASQHVAEMPPSDNRDHAIGGLVYSSRWEDPVSSIAWANEITDAKRRQDVLTMVAEAYARKDPAGAAAWLPASGLPTATQQRLLGGRK